MKKISLKNYPSGVCPTIYLNQFDAGRQFQIAVVDENGADFSLSAYTVKINGRKADDHVFEYTEADRWKEGGGYIITRPISPDNVVTISTTEQMTAAAGDCLTQLVLIKTADGSIAGTLNFIMHVQEQPYANGDPSGSDFPEIIAMATAQMERAEAAAGVATTKASQAATSAGNAADSETNALSYKNAAESARDRSETAADLAEQWSAHPPQVNANGNWDVWNIPDQQYEDSGIDCGPTITLDPNGAITMLDPDGVARIDNISQSDTDPVFHFYIPRGKGISSIAKTGTSGLTDTYTITYSDGATYTYNVVNGKSAYASAVEGGYQGTEQDFYTDLGLFTSYAATAQQAATNASNSASAAATSATNAAASEASASSLATLAGDKAAAAASSASTAGQYATVTEQNARAAVTAKTQSETAATNAAASETAAAGYSSSAQGSAGDASNSAQAAAGSASNASGSATSAAGSAEDAESWAVGKRGGTDVPSTDPAYENNAKYYSQQAATSAAATADVSTGSTGKTVKVAINPTAAEISDYANGAIWIETT